MKSAVRALGDATKIPKYLRVSWLSCFPNEEELLLFYGSNVAFAVDDIAEADNHKKHSKELFMFNLFQKAVQNQQVHWTVNEKVMAQRVQKMKNKKENDEAFDVQKWEQRQRQKEELAMKAMIDALSILIQRQIDRTDDSSRYVVHCPRF